MNKESYGCKYWFEVYLDKGTIDGIMWDEVIRSTLSHIGMFRTLKIGLFIDGPTVRYFVGANKNLAALSNKLELMSFMPVEIDQLPHFVPNQAELFVLFRENGNILDLNEHYQINKDKTLVWTLFTVRNIIGNIHSTSAKLHFLKSDGTTSLARKIITGTPGHLVAINFRTNEKYGYKRQNRHLDIKKSLHLLTHDSSQALFEVETFPYMTKNAYLGLSNYDFDRHSFIIGATGSGKSKLIGSFVTHLLASPLKDNYRVIVIDPHAALENDLGHIEDSTILSFKSQRDSADIFSGNNTDMSAATELTCSLFSSLLGTKYTADVDRVLRFSHITLMTAQVMSLANLKRLLADKTYRQSVVRHVAGFVPDNVTYFFEHDFEHLVLNSHREAILPLIELVDEVGLRSSLGVSENQMGSLGHVIESNPLTVFSLNKVGMGNKVVKAVAGLLIQQIFLLAQSRQFNEKIILIVDEVSIVQTPVISQILAEARKYNLFIFLSQQYFGQIDEGLQNAIFSNVSNYYVFRVSEADARAIEGNITMELPKKVSMAGTRTINSVEDLRVPILTELDQRECIVRVSEHGKVLPAMKARTTDFNPPQVARKRETTLDTHTGNGSLPKPFSESSSQVITPSVTAAASTQNQTPANLMELLARQSSNRNKE